MSGLERLERAKGGPFVYRHQGEAVTAPDPAGLHFEMVLYCIQQETMPGTPGDIPYWKVRTLFERWAAHYDLPAFQSAQRLSYLCERYTAALTFDLRAHAQVDLGELWRSRRWVTLMDCIDHLPRWCYYSEAVANDPEHAEMLANVLAEQDSNEDGPAKPVGPPMSTWSPEVALLTEVKDAIRHLEYAVVAVNHQGKGPKPTPPTPSPGPVTILDGARKRGEYRRRKAAHDRLAARMLPHKAKADEQPEG